TPSPPPPGSATTPATSPCRAPCGPPPTPPATPAPPPRRPRPPRRPVGAGRPPAPTPGEPGPRSTQHDRSSGRSRGEGGAVGVAQPVVRDARPLTSGQYGDGVTVEDRHVGQIT